MKIILTTHQFFPEYYSGTEVLTYHVAKELQRRGHEVLVFTGYPAKDKITDDLRFDRYQFDGITVERFLHDLVPIGDQGDVMEMEYDLHFVGHHFREILAREKPDVVHFFHLGRLSSSPIPECIKKKIPAFFTPTDFWGVCPLNQLLLPDGTLCSGPDQNAVNCIYHLATFRKGYAANLFAYLPRWLGRLGVRFSNAKRGRGHLLLKMVHSTSIRSKVIIPRLNSLDSIFAPNRFMAEMLEKNGVDKQCIRLSPYGMDLDFTKPTRLPQRGGVLRVGFIGTLSRYKGVHLLIKAIRQTPDLPVEVKIYGDLSAYQEYATELQDLVGDDIRIRFLGTFDNDDIGKIFSELDVLIVPSIWYENTPLVIYSAQACGCPVLASDIGGISEVVRHEENGLLFVVGQVKEITKALVRLHKDRELLHLLASQSQKPRAISDYVTELLMEYESVLERKS